MPLRLLFLVAPLLLAGVVIAQPSQPDIPCYWRPTSLDKPWIGPELPCLEEVVPAGVDGELAYTSLAAGPDGTLYAARPLAGEVWALTDSDGDDLPETPRLWADGLTLPNALFADWQSGDLYVAGGPNIYRILPNGDVTVLVDDLPAGPGYWTGGLTIGELEGGEPRLFVGTGAACDSCETGETGRGAVWSFRLDGSDGRIEATGFRQPSDLTFANGAVWALDSAPASRFDTPNLDEVNRLVTGGDYGFPQCVGADASPACADTLAPTAVLPTGSTPLGLSGYPFETLPVFTDSLLVALAGSSGQFDLRGYALAQIQPDTGEVVVRIPQPADAGGPVDFARVQDLNYRTVGFYPERPYDVAVSQQGWVYISLSNGRILAIRPQSEVVY